MAVESAWKLGGLTWKQLGQRVWTEFNDDDILDRAAALSYYFLGAMFPLLLVLFSILGLLAATGGQIRQSIMQYASTVLPSTANGLVQQTLKQIMNASGGGKISFGLLLSLWSASAGVVGMMSALNVVYDIREQRSFVRVRSTAIGLTIAVSILIVLGLTLTLYGGTIAEYLGSHLGLSSVFVIAWKIVQWPVVLVSLLVSFSLLYYFGPSLRDQKWEWITPGSVMGLALWLIASIAFKIYLNHFNSYSSTYGSLGAVIILMIWLYVSGIAFLLGAEINTEIEHAAAEHGDREAKARGEIAPGVPAPRRVPVTTSPRRKEKRPAA
jgi:membrane protein